MKVTEKSLNKKERHYLAELLISDAWHCDNFGDRKVAAWLKQTAFRLDPSRKPKRGEEVQP